MTETPSAAASLRLAPMWMRQAPWLAAAHLRAALAKPALALVVVLSVCLSVLVFDGVLSVGFGLSRMLQGAAQADRALFLSANARYEKDSFLTERHIVALRREGIAVASPELVVTGLHAASRSGGRSNRVMLRGVTEAAFDLRPEVEIVAGRMFEAGRQEMIVGARIAAELRGLGIGDVVAAGKSARYTVVGHFAAGEGPHESEAWADLPIVQSTHERPTLASALWIRASAPGLLDAIRAAAQADARVEVQLIGERAYWENRASRGAPLLWTLAAAIGGLMAFGAGASTMCVSYWTVHGRAPQLATLRAVGFGRGAVALSLALETLALTLLGGIAGTAIAYLSFDGASAAMRNRGGNAELLTFDMAVTPAVAAIGLAAAAVIGLVGALLPAVQANRMRIAAALQRR